jgi:ABC-2 type transport system ATP-binding protein
MIMIGTSHTLHASPSATPTGRGTTEPVIAVRGLVKRYGRREVVHGLDLDVHRGEIVAFLGPNGAGKTTTVEILEGFRPHAPRNDAVLDLISQLGTSRIDRTQ